MTAIPETRPHSAALLAVLDTTGIDAAAGEQPPGTGWQAAPGSSPFVPYLVLHAIPGGSLDGTIGDPDDDLSAVWQVTAVGATHEQCELAADKARTALLTTPVTVAGRTTVRLRVDLLSGCRRDDTVPTPVWISTDRYRLDTTPA